MTLQRARPLLPEIAVARTDAIDITGNFVIKSYS
jgi:hypothetical protein